MQDGATTEVDAVVAFVNQHRADLLALRATVAGADEATQRSLDLLTKIETRANDLLAALADGCTVMATDSLGPRPAC
jgi:hypothetical protein